MHQMQPRVTKRKNRQHKMRSRIANLAARAAANNTRGGWLGCVGPVAPFTPRDNHTMSDYDAAALGMGRAHSKQQRKDAALV